MAGLKGVTGSARYQGRKSQQLDRVEHRLRKANAEMINAGLPKATAKEFSKGARATAEKMSMRERRSVLSRPNTKGLNAELKTSRAGARERNALGAAKKTVARRAAAGKKLLIKKGKTK